MVLHTKLSIAKEDLMFQEKSEKSKPTVTQIFLQLPKTAD